MIGPTNWRRTSSSLRRSIKQTVACGSPHAKYQGDRAAFWFANHRHRAGPGAFGRHRAAAWLIKSSANLGKLSALGGVRQFPLRVECASLAWHTLRAAADTRDELVSTLFDEHYPGLCRLASLLLGDPAEAEEVVQEAFPPQSLFNTNPRSFDASNNDVLTSTSPLLPSGWRNVTRGIANPSHYTVAPAATG